ncbi:four helix bundle protein [Candidatus Falkowbacteria bacterium]|nr:four helix bundle protein [Candidatus Falkowbacteria bacterium]
MQYHELEVYKKLFQLADEVFRITLRFPKYEMYELGSQVRRSSNSGPANIAETFGNKHTNIYLEGISRAMGEIRETQHHLNVALSREYIIKDKYNELNERYNECSKMLWGLEKSLKSTNN